MLLTLLVALGCHGPNTAPHGGAVALPGPSPSTDERLVCEVTTPAVDDEGDEVAWSFAWSRDGAAYAGPTGTSAHPGDTIEPGETRNDQEWTCTASYTDGEAEPVVVTAVTRVRPASVIVMMTDDQRWDTTWAMPLTDAWFSDDRGVWFDEAYVTTPLCCPARASWLSGGMLPKDTNVFGNGAPNGGVAAFDDADTLATRFQAAGWTTGHVGRYLNEYYTVLPYIPPGWDVWRASSRDVESGNESYSGGVIVEGTSTPDAAGVGTEMPNTTYLTTWHADAATGFIEEQTGPFFLFVAFVAPHFPSEPAAGDGDLRADYVHDNPGVQETDRSDKPPWIANTPADPEAVQDELETLAAVDRAVDDIFASLEASGHLADTFVVFTSDHGTLWGEHGMLGKSLPYDEAIRVPLAVRAPDAVGGRSDALVAANLDVPATISALTGVGGATRGLDLTGVLAGAPPEEWRTTLVFQSWDTRTWVAILTPDLKVIEWADNRWIEAYDRALDPYEITSVVDEATYAESIAAALAELRSARGMAVEEVTMAATAGERFTGEVPVYGGTPPYTVIKESGPVGFDVAPNGTITALAPEPGLYHVVVTVSDSSVSPWSGEPQRQSIPVHIEAN